MTRYKIETAVRDGVLCARSVPALGDRLGPVATETAAGAWTELVRDPENISHLHVIDPDRSLCLVRFSRGEAKKELHLTVLGPIIRVSQERPVLRAVGDKEPVVLRGHEADGETLHASAGLREIIMPIGDSAPFPSRVYSRTSETEDGRRVYRAK